MIFAFFELACYFRSTLTSSPFARTYFVLLVEGLSLTIH